MKLALITSCKPDSFTVQAMLQAMLKHDPTARAMHLDDMALVQHSQGDQLIHEGQELEKHDAIITLVDVHCPSYYAILDSLNHYAPLVVNDGKVHRDTMDELNLYRQLQRVNVKFPTTVSVFKPEAAELVASSFETLKGSAFPLLVRLLLNQHKNGLIKVDSLGSLRTVVEAFCEEELPFVIQEHTHHRGAFTAYVFAGEVLGAIVCEVADADDEFRAGLKGTLATAANLDDVSNATMARVSNVVGRSLVEVTFVKDVNGEPLILDVKPYVRFDALNHSTGQPLAEEVMAKLFDRLGALLPKADEPEEVEATATDVPDDELPSRAIEVDLIVYPLNDDRPIAAKLQTEEDRHTIYVQDLQGDDNYLSFRFGGYKYRLPRRDAVESSTDSKKSFHNVVLTVKRDDQTFTALFTLTDEGGTDRAHQVWINPDLLPKTEPEIAQQEPEVVQQEPEAAQTIPDDVPTAQPAPEAPTDF